MYLQAHLHITAKSIIAYVEDQWNIRYSESGMTDLLHRLGYVYKKPKLVPGKVDETVKVLPKTTKNSIKYAVSY